MELTINALNYLFAPLHMHVKYDKPSYVYPYGLYDSSNRIMSSKSTELMLLEKSIDVLWNEIINAPEFIWGYEQVCGCVNPYFNCKSLEEAMIKRDLIA